MPSPPTVTSASASAAPSRSSPESQGARWYRVGNHWEIWCPALGICPWCAKTQPRHFPGARTGPDLLETRDSTPTNVLTGTRLPCMQSRLSAILLGPIRAHVDASAVADIGHSIPRGFRLSCFAVVEVQCAAQSLPAGHPTLEPPSRLVTDDQLAFQVLMVAFTVIVVGRHQHTPTQTPFAPRTLGRWPGARNVWPVA